MTPDQRILDQNPLSTLTETDFREVYRIIAEGVVSLSQVGSSLNNNPILTQPAKYEGGGLGPSSTSEEVRATLPHLRVVRERETGKTFYRLGDEFMTVEALGLVIRLNPDSDTRREAQQILDAVHS